MRLLAPFASVALIVATGLFSGCSSPQSEPVETITSPILTSEEAKDDFTFARAEIARVSHVALDLNLDFAGKSVSGTATLDIQAAEGAGEIILDSDGLQIASITDADGNALDFTLGNHVDGKGEPLTIAIGQEQGNPRQITITYAAAKEAEALQWLAPQQTAGGEHPFLFSQGQAILNRTWIPTQDSPGIRQTWEARITAPSPLNVVMSGILGGEPVPAGRAADGSVRRTFSFAMDKPVAPYLIAIAAGNISFRELGSRSGVWAEPEMLDAAAAELSDTEAMIDAAEALFGEYRWGRYDMIVLPPAFPYGGMENPVMTFLTPTFIAGDRSLTGLVAHELAHSWSGNLVTYASWRDGWLNEGVTSYLESRISEVVFGEKRAGQERALGFVAVEEAVADYGPDAPITALRTPQGLDPLEYDSTIVYDKGATFLHTLEHHIGREKFDAWLKSWFDRHAFEPATSEMFLADLRENVIGDDAELEDRLQLEEWVYGMGLPDNVARAEADAFAQVDSVMAAYAENGALDGDAWAGWTTAEQMRFMRSLPKEMSADDLGALDMALGLSETGNNEIRFLWLQSALANRYDPAVPLAQDFLKTVGRNKFVEPLFEALMETPDWGVPIARALYAETRPSYHSYTRGKVDALVPQAESE